MKGTPASPRSAIALLTAKLARARPASAADRSARTRRWPRRSAIARASAAAIGPRPIQVSSFDLKLQARLRRALRSVGGWGTPAGCRSVGSRRVPSGALGDLRAT
jgi:hypothetical protein